MRKTQKPKLSKGENSKDLSNHNEDYSKKMMHRDLERQRRQEMATLNASLRNLLPFQYIKGRRSVSDQMDGALSYITDLKQKVKEISSKKDDLKKIKDRGVSVTTETSSSYNSSPSCNVLVSPCSCGFEVLVSTSLEEQGLPLSRVLKVICDQGHSVSSCVSTRVNERFLHTIQVEVGDILACFDIFELQRKLMEEITLLTW